MRKSYYTNGYTNDHDPTYYRDSYEQARRPRRVCRRGPDTGGRDDMARLGSAGRVWAGHGWLGVAWLGVAWQGRQGWARHGAGLGYTTREVYREHNFNHHFHTTIREDS